MDRFQRESYAPIHRGVYELARESTDAFESARARIAEFVGLGPCVLDLHAQRHRGDQPGRVLVGPREHRGGRRGAHHRDGAPLEHRALADPLRGDRREAALPHAHRQRGAVARRARLGARRGAREARGRGARVERARHDQPGGRDRAARTRRRRRDRDRRRAGGATAAAGPARDRRGLLRLDRPQGARPHDRPAARAARAARRHAAVPRRRPHDLACGARALHLERAAVQVRGRHLGGHRGRRARRGGRVPRRDRHGAASARTSAT